MSKQRKGTSGISRVDATDLQLPALHPIRAGVLRTFGVLLSGVLGSSPAVYANPHPIAGTLPTITNILSVHGGKGANTLGSGAGCVATVCVMSTPTITTVTQSTNGIIINWNNFDIGAGAGVSFMQNPNAVAINYVQPGALGGDGMATGIFGSLTAQGHIFVINPMGVVVGSGGSVNAGSVVLSSLDLPSDIDTQLTGQANWDSGAGTVTVPFISGSTGGAVNVADGASVAGTNGVFLLGNSVQVGAGVSPGATIGATAGPVVLAAVDNGTLNLNTTANTGGSTFTTTAGTSNLSSSSGISVGANSQISGNGVVADALTNSLVSSSQIMNLDGVINSTSDVNVVATDTGSSTPGLEIGGPINAAGSAVSLTSTGAITQQAGAGITSQSLTGGSVNGASLTANTNQIGQLNGFSNTGSGDFALTDAGALNVTGPVSSAGNLTLGTSGAGNGIALNAGLTGNTVALNSAGAITGSGSVSATTLTGTSNGGAALNGQVANLGSFANTGSGNLSLADTQALNVTGPVSSTGNVTLGTSGAGNGIALNGTVSGTTVALNSAAAITQGAGGGLTATTLTGGSKGGATLSGQFNNLGGFANTGSGDLVLTDSHALAVTGPASSAGNLTLATTGAGNGIALNSTVSGSTVALNSAGAITGGGSVSATTLTGSSNGGGAVSGQFANLGNFANTGTGNLTFNDSQALNVSGAVNSSNALTLNSAGAITQGAGGSITATTLAGTSNGGATLSGQFANLGGFTNSGSGDLSLTDAQALTVTGPVADSVGNVTLATTGTGNGIALNSTVTSSGTLALNSAATLTQGAGGGITANTLTGTSTGATTLTGQFANLGNFNGGGNMTLTDATALNVTGKVSAGNLTLATTGSGNGMTLGGTLNGSTSIALNSAGGITQSGGTITTTTLTGSAVSGAQLTSATNSIQRLGDFAVTGTGDFALTSSRTLAINGKLNVGSNNATVSAVGANSAMTVSGLITGATVELDAASQLSETGSGAIAATTLKGSGVGGVTLNGSGNMIAALGNLSNTGKGALAVTDASGLAVNGAVTSTGDLSLTTTGAAANGIALSGTGSVVGGTVTFKSAGALSEGSGGVLSAATFTGNSTGGASLTGANLIGNLGAFTNTGTGDVALTNAQALAVTGAVNAGTGNNLALATTSGNLGINAGLTGTTVGLNSAGGLSEGSGGSVTAATLTGGATAGVALNGSNQIAALGPFNNTGTGDLALTNGSALTVTGPVSSSNNLSLTTTGTNALTVNGTLAGTGVALNAGGALGEGAGGGIAAGTLTGTSTGGAALSAGANQIGNLGNFTNGGTGDVAVSNGQAMNVTGAVNAGSGNNLTLATTGGGDIGITGSVTGNAVALNATGTLNENSGAVIAAGTLTGTSTGGAALNAGTNQIGSLGVFTNSGSGAVAVSSAQAMNVTGAVNAGSGNNLTLTTAGNLGVNNALTGNTVALNSGGTLGEGSGGVITATSLQGTSTGGADLSGAGNQFSNLNGFTNSGTGNVAIADSQGMTISAPVVAGGGNALALSSGGSITGTAGAGQADVTANQLSLTAPTGSAVLSTAVDVLNANVSGDLTVTQAQPGMSLNNVNAGGTATFNVPGNFALTGAGASSQPNLTAQNVVFNVGNGSTIGASSGVALLTSPKIVVLPNGDPVLNFGRSVSVLSVQPGSGVVHLNSIGGHGASNVVFFANVVGPGGQALGNSAVVTDGTVSFGGGQSLTLGDTLTRLDAIQQSFTRLVVPDLSGGEEFVRTSTDSMTPPPEADTSSRNDIEPLPADTDVAARR